MTASLDEHSQRRRIRASALVVIGLVVNVILATVKLTAGLLGNSFALVADAVESMADILGSIVIWGGLRYGARPPDENHPFGHGKAESLAALAVGLMIIVAGLLIAVGAVRGLFEPQEPPKVFTLWVLGGVILVKETLYRFGHRLGLELESSAVSADAWHHRSDAMTSAAAAVGILVAILGGPGWESADRWAALFAAGVIVFNGWRVARVPFGEIMDEQPDHLPPRIMAIAMSVDGVREVHAVRARRAGMRCLVDLHVQVDPLISVREGHALGGRVKAEIMAQLPIVETVLIHLEPFEGHGRASEPDAETSAETGGRDSING